MSSSIPNTLIALAALGLASCDARPAQEGGSTGVPTSGAHTVHLVGTFAPGLSCGDCHDSQFQVTFPAKAPPGVTLARANGAEPIFNTTTLTCSNVYCHDGGPQLQIGGGTVPTPLWNPPPPIVCGGCHALPGGSIATPWHPQVAIGVQCALCHPGYTNTTVNRDIHVNGVADLTRPDMATNCAACHGDPTRVVPAGGELVRAAPPVDRNGGSATTLASVGAHQAHLMPGANAISDPIACAECHVVPTDLAHVGPDPATPVTLDWGLLASANGATPAYDSTAATCTNYCHGQTLLDGGRLTQPTWTKVDQAQAACGTCHGSPPTDGSHSLHADQGSLNITCSGCHPTGYAINSVGPDAVPSHVNGVVNVNAATLPSWNPTATGANGWTGTSVGCHGGTRYWRRGSLPTSCG